MTTRTKLHLIVATTKRAADRWRRDHGLACHEAYYLRGPEDVAGWKPGPDVELVLAPGFAGRLDWPRLRAALEARGFETEAGRARGEAE